jgi:hypothetical protein
MKALLVLVMAFSTYLNCSVFAWIARLPFGQLVFAAADRSDDPLTQAYAAGGLVLAEHEKLADFGSSLVLEIGEGIGRRGFEGFYAVNRWIPVLAAALLGVALLLGSVRRAVSRSQPSNQAA